MARAKSTIFELCPAEEEKKKDFFFCVPFFFFALVFVEVPK